MKLLALALLALVAATAAHSESKTRCIDWFVAALRPLTPGLAGFCRR
jgi:hypothetical protein